MYQITAEPAENFTYRPVLIDERGEWHRLYGLARKTFKGATAAGERHMRQCMPQTVYVVRSH